jgi:hypothetical protein
MRDVCRIPKREGCDSLETQSLNQDPLENTFVVIRLHCSSNNNATVRKFVDALKTSITKGLVAMQTVRVMRLSFWIIYIPFSRNLVHLHSIYSQVTVGTPFMMVLVALMLQDRRSGK